MHKIVLKLLLLLLPSISFSQYLWDFGGGIAASNYLGEIGGKEKSRRGLFLDLRIPHTRIGLNGYGRYKLNPLISVKAAFNYTQIVGSDANSIYAPRRARNLSFRNNVFELNVTGEIFFFEVPNLVQSIKKSADFRAYVFLGVGVLKHNPKALYNGQWVALQPLQTEGVPYNLVTATIPMGVGAYFTVNRKYRIGLEVGYRKTFTDYLDDVSDRYGDPSKMTPEGAALSNRSQEIKGKTGDDYVEELLTYNYGYNTGTETGALRGEVKHKDAIVTAELQFSYVLRGKSSFYRSRYPGLFGKKNKKRRIRAKF